MQHFNEQFSACERGNIWIWDDEGRHNAWFRFGDGEWLEVSVRHDNYPGFNVRIIKATDDELAHFIRSNFGGWSVNKMNLSAHVPINEDNVIVGYAEYSGPCPKCACRVYHHAEEDRFECQNCGTLFSVKNRQDNICGQKECVKD